MNLSPRQLLSVLALGLGLSSLVGCANSLTLGPAPGISSFSATPATIAKGQSASLLAVFTGGSAVITPGNLLAPNGVAVTVAPAATTTYLLTVTDSHGATVTQSYTVSVAAPPPSGPPAPTALQATPRNQLVDLSWTGNADAASYAVLRSTISGGPYAAIGATTSTVFEDEAVVNNTTYYYVVAALDSSGQGPNSLQASATPVAPPAPPANLVATPGDGQATLSWSPGTGAATYSIGRSTASGGPYTLVGSSAAPSFTDTELTDATPYYYVVYSLNPVGTSTASNQAVAIPIGVPASLAAVAGDQQVALFWSPTQGAASYHVLESPQSAGPYAQIATSQMPRYVDTGLTDGVPRFYRVAAVNSTGVGALSSPASATPSANAIPLPPAEDESQNHVGLGNWFVADWDGNSAFADVFKQSRPWMDAAWVNPAAVDSLGWPTQDASTVLFTDTTGTQKAFDGVYKLVFNGQATLSFMWCAGGIANQAYDPVTNTTTADVTFTESPLGSPSFGLIFTNTRRTAAGSVGSGFTNARLYRPGYPSDGSVVYTAPFLAALGKVSTIRMMEWTGAGSNFVVHWADRAKPGSATQGGLPAPPYTAPDGAVFASTLGVALEYQILLCNTLQADCYINIPPVASDDFVTNMALALQFGTDGVNPYTAHQANPVFPPLNPTLRLYLEYGNEVWNSASTIFPVVKAICENLPPSHPLKSLAVNNPYNPYYVMWRYPAWRIATVSQIFSSVFGSNAMMTRVRPVLMTQEGDGQATLDQALEWLDAYAPTLTPAMTIPQLIYGGGGSAYYGVVNSQSADPDAFFATGNYPDPGVVQQWAIDSLWDSNYGIRHIAYEGGPGLSFTDKDNDAINADPRMKDMVTAYQDEWSAQGGDLLVYYTVRGPSNWEFTPDIANTGTPKFAALAAIQSAPRAAVTLGASLPGTLTASAEASLNARSPGSYSYTATIGGVACTAPSGTAVGAFSAYPAHAASAFAGTLTLTGSASAATQLAIWINGVRQGTVSMAAQANQALEDSTALPVAIPAGVVAIRMETLQGSMTFCSLTVQ